MNFTQKRDLFNKKQGGLNKLLYNGIYVDKHDRINEYEEPNCICGQHSKTIYQLINVDTKIQHWVGTCCINHYFDATTFGGIYGIKQRSKKEFYQTLKNLCDENIIVFDTEADKNDYLGIIQLNQKYDLLITQHKHFLENILGIDIRFKSIDVTSEQYETLSTTLFNEDTMCIKTCVNWLKGNGKMYSFDEYRRWLRENM